MCLSWTASVSEDQFLFVLSFFSATIEPRSKSSLREGGTLAVKKNRLPPRASMRVRGRGKKRKKSGGWARMSGCEKIYSPVTLTRRRGSTIQGQNTENPHESRPAFAAAEEKIPHALAVFRRSLLACLALLSSQGPARATATSLQFLSCALFLSPRLTTFYRARSTRVKMQRPWRRVEKDEEKRKRHLTFPPYHNYDDRATNCHAQPQA